MASFFTDNEDLLFYLNEGIDWAALAEVTEYGWRTPDGFKNGDRGASSSTSRSRRWWASSWPSEVAPRAARRSIARARTSRTARRSRARR